MKEVKQGRNDESCHFSSSHLYFFFYPLSPHAVTLSDGRSSFSSLALSLQSLSPVSLSIPSITIIIIFAKMDGWRKMCRWIRNGCKCYTTLLSILAPLLLSLTTYPLPSSTRRIVRFWTWFEGRRNESVPRERLREKFLSKRVSL